MRAVLLSLLLNTCGFAAYSHACLPPPGQQDQRSVQAAAQKAIRSAAVIVDAQVIATGYDQHGYGWADLRPLRVWKGPKAASYRVRQMHSCGIGEWTIGHQHRILLERAGDTLTADMGLNGNLSGELLPQFAAEVDRLIGSRRPAAFRHAGVAYVSTPAAR